MKSFTLIETMICVAIFGIIIAVVVPAVNSIGIETRPMIAGVVDKHHKPAHYTYSSYTDSNGRVQQSSTYHAAVWRVTTVIEGERINCSTSEGKYSAVSIGEKVKISAGTGRLFKSYVCKDIILGDV